MKIISLLIIHIISSLAAKLRNSLKGHTKMGSPITYSNDSWRVFLLLDQSTIHRSAIGDVSDAKNLLKKYMIYTHNMQARNFNQVTDVSMHSSCVTACIAVKVATTCIICGYCKLDWVGNRLALLNSTCCRQPSCECSLRVIQTNQLQSESDN